MEMEFIISFVSHNYYNIFNWELNEVWQVHSTFFCRKKNRGAFFYSHFFLRKKLITLLIQNQLQNLTHKSCWEFNYLFNKYLLLFLRRWFNVKIYCLLSLTFLRPFLTFLPSGPSPWCIFPGQKCPFLL